MRRRALLTAALLTGGILVLLAGASPWSIAVALLLPFVLLPEVPEPPARMLPAVIAGLAAASGGGTAGCALAAVAALLMIADSDSRHRRLLLVIPLAALAAGGALPPPLVAGSAAAAFPGRRPLRWAALAAGGVACLLLGGLPGTGAERVPLTARGLATAGGIVWPDTITLDHAEPVLRLDLSPAAGMPVRLRVSAGGVRDDRPVGRLEHPDGAVSLVLPGDTVLSLTASEGAAFLVLTRSWEPFNHPVLRFMGASTEEIP